MKYSGTLLIEEDGVLKSAHLDEAQLVEFLACYPELKFKPIPLRALRPAEAGVLSLNAFSTKKCSIDDSACADGNTYPCNPMCMVWGSCAYK